MFKHTQYNHLDLQIKKITSINNKKSPQSTGPKQKTIENFNPQIINQWRKKSPQSTSVAGRVCVGGCSQTAGSPSWVVRIFRSISIFSLISV